MCGLAASMAPDIVEAIPMGGSQWSPGCQLVRGVSPIWGSGEEDILRGGTAGSTAAALSQ